MSILKIAKMGNPVLLEPAEIISDPKSPEIVQLIQDMIETMIDADGLGLAAPQVHVSKQLVMFFLNENSENNNANLNILINPVIEPLSEEIIYDWEGCLSVPGLRGLVPRYKSIKYSGLDHLGKIVEKKAIDFHARVIQHECDHLQGIIYPQRMDNLKNLIFQSELKHIDNLNDFDPKRE